MRSGIEKNFTSTSGFVEDRQYGNKRGRKAASKDNLLESVEFAFLAKREQQAQLETLEDDPSKTTLLQLLTATLQQGCSPIADSEVQAIEGFVSQSCLAMMNSKSAVLSEGYTLAAYDALLVAALSASLCRPRLLSLVKKLFRSLSYLCIAIVSRPLGCFKWAAAARIAKSKSFA